MRCIAESVDVAYPDVQADGKISLEAITELEAGNGKDHDRYF